MAPRAGDGRLSRAEAGPITTGMAGSPANEHLPWWSWVLPAAGWAALAALHGATGPLALVLAAALVGTVFAAATTRRWWRTGSASPSARWCSPSPSR